MAWIIGVDVDGTFTDFCVLESDTSAIHIHKTPSTPEQRDPQRVQEDLRSGKFTPAFIQAHYGPPFNGTER